MVGTKQKKWLRCQENAIRLKVKFDGVLRGVKETGLFTARLFVKCSSFIILFSSLLFSTVFLHFIHALVEINCSLSETLCCVRNALPSYDH